MLNMAGRKATIAKPLYWITTMHNPPHPSAFIRKAYLDPFKVSYRTAAVSPSTFNRLVTGKSNISLEMALRLSKTLDLSPESWLAIQDHYGWRVSFN